MTAIDYFDIISKGDKTEFWKSEIVSKISYKPSANFLMSDHYKVVLKFYLKKLYAIKLKGTDSIKYTKMGLFNFILEYISLNDISGSLEEYLVSQIMNDILNEYKYSSHPQQDNYDTLFTSISKRLTSRLYVQHYNNLYKEVKKSSLNQLPGRRAPEFTVTDSTGKLFGLDNFKGKIVLLDVWASWCGPCIKEFPFLKSLELKFKDRHDFQVLSISVDDTKDLWLKNGLEKFNPPGFPLWEGTDGNFSKNYQIYQIPVLVLIDRDGNLIEFNPPRASEGNDLFNLILQSLQKN